MSIASSTQHRLAHPGVAEQQDEVRTVVLDRRPERVPEQGDLGLASDERTSRAPRTRTRGAERLERAPRTDGGLAALHGEGAELLVADRLFRRLVRRRADEHVARLGRGLQPLGDVHDVAERRDVAAGAQRADEHLARVHADPHPDVRTRLRGVLGERALHLQRAADGALGIVLVGDRARRRRP